jgi:two-component system C4-dicarboxylate transport response regulator DctD
MIPTTANRLVLVVEDDADVAKMCKACLEPVFIVEHVRLASEGMARLSQSPLVAAMVLDLRLPNGEGVELIKRFQGRFPEVPIVVLTGYEYDYEQVFLEGAQEFLRKPVLSTRLVESVSHAVARHQSRGLFRRVDLQLEKLKEMVENPKANKITDVV